jgi:hypothetical protein
MSSTHYPNRTLLRYYSTERETHDTALVLEGGEVLHVKQNSQPIKKKYPSVEAWLESLPDTPSIDQLEVTEPGEEKEKEEKDTKKEKGAKKEKEKEVETKEKKTRSKKGKGEETEEKKKAPVPLLIRMSKQIPSTYWTHHLYRMMREANPLLLKRVDVVEAFNALVQFLLDNQAHIVSYDLTGRTRYREGVEIEKNPMDHPLKGMCSIRMNTVARNPETGNLLLRYPYMYDNPNITPKLSAEEMELRDQLIVMYQAWFVLVKDDILPYMKQRDNEIIKQEKDKRIESIARRIQALEENHNKEVERRQRQILSLQEKHERMISVQRSLIARLSRENEEVEDDTVPF